MAEEEVICRMFEIIDKQGRKFLGTTQDKFDEVPLRKYEKFDIARVNIIRRFHAVDIEGYGDIVPRLTYLQMQREDYDLNIKPKGERYYRLDVRKYPEQDILTVYEKMERDFTVP